VTTNLSFHERVLANAEFQAGGIDTGFLQRLLESGEPSSERVRHG